MVQNAELDMLDLGNRSPEFGRAIAAIDELNDQDPHVVQAGGRVGPKELRHSILATQWLLKLDPTATEGQLLAARAHHLARWKFPRDEYPTGRAGYLKWRAAAKKQHANDIESILVDAGVDAETTGRTKQIVAKMDLKFDGQVQSHEDALCLVFLQTQLDEFAYQRGEEKTVEVLAKTMKKMSPAGIAMVSDIDLGESGERLLAQASEELSQQQ